MPAVDLGGTFHAAPADEHLRRSFHTDDFDDSAWEPIQVPGHWRSTPAFAECDGPLLHRRTFEAPTTDGQRWWLELDGLFSQGDVWLDGDYVGDTEGYFVPHLFEVTEHLQARGEHHLAIEVTCAPQPDWNPGGIWQPIRLRPSGPVRITRLRAICREARAERAVVAFDATFDAADATTACVQTTIGTLDHETTVPLAAGTNDVSWTVTVDRPARWWPHALGDPVLHDVTVAVTPEHAERPADQRQLRIGLREIRMRDWVAAVNGERLFLKGSNHAPTHMALAEATPDELRRDVALARDANLDLLRIHEHVTRSELYDAADEAGLLLWQDLPTPPGSGRGVRRQGRRQAAAMVDLLGHHPSIAIWGGRTRSGRRAIEGADASRPVVVPHPTLDGRYSGDDRAFVGFTRLVPRMARFVTDYGGPDAPVEADVVRHHVEHLRRIKYRPAGGFTQHRTAALGDSCQPVIVAADLMPATIRPGRSIALDVHVVSDLRTAIDRAEVRAEITWAGGTHRWAWTGAVPADSCVRVGTVRFVAPDAQGPLRLELRCTHDGDETTNQYETRVEPRTS